MPTFAVVDLTAQCEVRQNALYEYELLERIEGAADLIGQCSAALWRDPEEFELMLSTPGSGLQLRWRASAPTAGIAVLRDRKRLLSFSLLMSGMMESADDLTLQAFQTHVVRELHDTGFEASFGLADIRQRPLLATMGLAVPEEPALRWLFGLSDRCLAAAYFRKLGLI